MHKLQRGCSGNPFCISEDVRNGSGGSPRFCIAGKGAEGEISAALSDLGFTVIIIPPDEGLPLRIAHHADLSLFFSGSALFMRASYDKRYSVSALLASRGIKYPVVLTDGEAGDYPLDTALCAKIAGGCLVCREKSSSPELISSAADAGLCVMNVKQGYAACSIAVTYDGSVITQDAGIAAEARKRGVETLLTERGGISLPGYGDGCEGFIGGCTGLCGRYLFFTGNLSLHPAGRCIADFCRAHGTEPVSLSRGPLEDIGGLIFI